jgi:hypothetical protein
MFEGAGRDDGPAYRQATSGFVHSTGLMLQFNNLTSHFRLDVWTQVDESALLRYRNAARMDQPSAGTDQPKSAGDCTHMRNA